MLYNLAAAAVVVAAAAIAATAVVGAQNTAAAVAQEQDDQDDPANITAAETIVTHNQIPPKFCRGDLPLIPRYSDYAKRFKIISKVRRGKRPGQPAPSEQPRPEAYRQRR